MKILCIYASSGSGRVCVFLDDAEGCVEAYAWQNVYSCDFVKSGAGMFDTPARRKCAAGCGGRQQKVGQTGQPQQISIACISLPTLAAADKKKVCLAPVSADRSEGSVGRCRTGVTLLGVIGYTGYVFCSSERDLNWLFFFLKPSVCATEVHGF